IERKHLTLAEIAGTGDLAKRLELIFDHAAKIAADPGSAESLREPAIRLLGRRPARESEDLDLLGRLLDPSAPPRLQTAALDALKHNRSEKVAALLVKGWNHLAPSLRPSSIEVLLSREGWTKQLLEGVENGVIGRNEVSLIHRQHLLKDANQEIHRRAAAIWAASSTSRAEVVAKYHSALTLT